ncbi:tyrosine-type recombinase/integrase [Morganella morganii subsp. morganii]|nr:tyrosine-type recombinase/integrase [Morganella morganii]ELA8471752.1 tyrosine-type recombinase/integrase [Morganella morganii]MBA5854256.1 tyrosine-type recombinase/integrase [Morganella morganii]MBT0445557.1 tyrosine-type recombinase/integrase [Morganella morganii subsp. morganii]MBT0449152.1 tyrosine-type recombinase/integrase [Morganella morganii subsp. morganii]MBT0507332.1 tyrosine-type recombinase/integrase [Morganella morganii subsp. morganii]
MTNDLSIQVEHYLSEKRGMGFEMSHASYCLRSFSRYIQQTNYHGPLTLELMTEWASKGRYSETVPVTMAHGRLKYLRPFMRWLQLSEPDAEVPDNSICGRKPGRGTPHIYNEKEIEELLAAARRLGPDNSIRGLLYETLFGLLASTGLRVSEALSLRISDVDLNRGMLIIRRTKFGKSRSVVLHPSANDALYQYLSHRKSVGAASDENAHFFIGLRVDVLGKPLKGHQVRQVFRALRQELGWNNRGTHHAPRIHDLRHSFAVRRVLLWQQQGVDVDHEMLSLSTYLGHANIADTYWYLQAVPELMAVSARQFEMSMPEVCDE